MSIPTTKIIELVREERKRRSRLSKAGYEKLFAPELKAASQIATRGKLDSDLAGERPKIAFHHGTI